MLLAPLAKSIFVLAITFQILLVTSSGETISQSDINKIDNSENGSEQTSSTWYQIISWIINYCSKAVEKLSPLFILYGTAAFIGFAKKLF